MAVNVLVLVAAFFTVSEALRCYQGQHNASLPIQFSPTECIANSMSCILTLDQTTNTVTRACQISNCTLNGMLSTSPVCTNSTTGLTTYCCCYGDGCNTDPKEMTNPRPKEKNLAGRVAQRIENFYDRDAVSSERNFIRRVVNHVYEHIDDGANAELLPRWMQIP